MAALWVIVAIVVVVGLYAGALYNRLVALRNAYRNSYAAIDVELKRRYDLIPNLVEAAKGYMAHERGTLEAVTQARAAASSAAGRAAAAPGDPAAMQALSHAETALGSALGRLLAVVESYPDLKANQNVMSLQGELIGTENQIASTRQVYNLDVTQYNTTREQFPAALFSRSLGFAPAGLLEATQSAEERAAPKVRF